MKASRLDHADVWIASRMARWAGEWAREVMERATIEPDRSTRLQESARAAARLAAHLAIRAVEGEAKRA